MTGVRPRGPAAGAAATAAGLVVLAVVAALTKARSYDLWWHLETGRQILLHRAVPRVDDFSFTAAGTPWVDHEWLFQLIFYAGYALLGEAAFTLLKIFCALGVAWAGAFALGWRPLEARTGRSTGLALGVVAVAMAGLRFRLAERPETVTLLMAAASAAIVVSLASRPGAPAIRTAALAILTVVWVNLHAGALIAPVIAAAMAGGAAIAAAAVPAPQRSQARAALRATAVAAVAALICLPVNPHGLRVFEVPLRIGEALAPANVSNPEWAPPAFMDFPLFFVCVGLGAALACAGIARRETESFPRAALLVTSAALGLASVRHIGLFFALLPMAVDTGVLRRFRGAPATAAGWAAALAAAAWMALVPPVGAVPGTGIQRGRFPEQAADFIDATMPQARLYNDVAFGGYLIWRGYPHRRVFIDGRNEVHAGLLLSLSRAIDDGRAWSRLLEDHAVEGAVVAYRPDPIRVRDAGTGEISTSTFAEAHFPRRDWALVHWDDVAMVFVRRAGPWGHVADGREYAWARPEIWNMSNQAEPHAEAPPPLADEILRKIKEDPACALAKKAASLYRIRVTAPDS